MDPLTTGPGSLSERIDDILEVVEENNKILRRMERNATISLIVKIVIWLLVLGVPLFFLSTYVGPLISAINGNPGGNTLNGGMFGLPSAEQLKGLFDQYQQTTGQSQ